MGCSVLSVALELSQEAGRFTFRGQYLFPFADAGSEVRDQKSSPLNSLQAARAQTTARTKAIVREVQAEEGGRLLSRPDSMCSQSSQTSWALGGKWRT